jgi:hypothetical protein
MTRILLIESASSKRIVEKAEHILLSGKYPNPEITILCDEKNSTRYLALPGTTVHSLSDDSKRCIPKELLKNRFDVTFAFWTGENAYRWWKLLAFRLKAKERMIVGGDGNEFRLTWRAVCRHAIFRLRHPLPTDHRDYVNIEGKSEHVLIVQSAEPGYVFQAMKHLDKHPLFINPRFTIFCRNRPEIAGAFQNNPIFQQVLIHSEAQDSWVHWRFLRQQQFDGIVLLLTGDPSYWKVKLFAFLLGTRRILIFNETMDCFFFSFHQWLALVSHRLRGWPDSAASSKWSHSIRILLSLLLKSVSLPFRFLWLLVVWLRLRLAGLRSLRKSHDYSL